MRGIFGIIILLLTIISCQENKNKITTEKRADWENRKSEIEDFGNLVQGKTYLPVYSHIYHHMEDRKYLLTVTVSIRNTSPSDSIHILKADYYNTEGGSGANFIFDWAVKNEKNPPLFEAVMISTHGTQGLSFTTRGIQIFN